MFQKGYKPQKPAEAIIPLHKQALISNVDGFYNNSAPLSAQQLRKHKTRAIDKAVRLEHEK